MRNIDYVVSVYRVIDYWSKDLRIVRAGHKDEIFGRIRPHDVVPCLHVLPDAEPVGGIRVIKNPVAIKVVHWFIEKLEKNVAVVGEFRCHIGPEFAGCIDMVVCVGDVMPVDDCVNVF